MARRRKKLGEILVSWGIVSEAALNDALDYAKEHGKRIGEALVELELASDEDVTKALATQFDLEYVDLEKNEHVRSELQLEDKKLILREKFLPLKKEGKRHKDLDNHPLDH
ncbi:MAG: hypothetical protein AB7N71_11690, partial [Phycisphaerae bacterium]